jgi:hypothetical protein
MKLINIKFHGNPFNGSRVGPLVQNDRSGDNTKLSAGLPTRLKTLFVHSLYKCGLLLGKEHKNSILRTGIM